MAKSPTERQDRAMHGPRAWREVGARALSVVLMASVLLCSACERDEQGAGAAPPQAERAHGPSSVLSLDRLPGAPPLDGALVARLDAAWRSRDAGYAPRTKHLRPDGTPRYTNRLFLESSPYLRQHAHNPVNWYPWGDEAFETARRLGRPVLVSIGYSTCHWCHVMEEESFEDVEVARLLNERYVAIKVDREERPDIDAIYMSAVQALTGGGGWPMNVWLNPDREPFYGGTYFPARDGDRGVQVGFTTLLVKLADTYSADPQRVAAAAGDLAVTIRQRLAPATAQGRLPGADVLRSATGFYAARFDATFGGLAGAPKFPSSLPVRFLLRHHRRTRDQQSLKMAVSTLEKMAAGGMYDHVGGGFHRYSTDASWLVPHFEKMLYDNALLAGAYLDAYQATGRDDFARVAREVLRYVERDMTSPDGAFYAATDADSLTPSGRREEGWFFTWTPAEIDAALDAEHARATKAYYAVTAAGNLAGRSILHTPTTLDAVADQLGVPPERLRDLLAQSRERLYEVRTRRPAPLRDEKVIAAWNGLMISAYARAALVLDERRYADIATRAADFVLGNMREGERLRRSFKDGAARHNAYLDDYAFMIAGLLDLYEATGARRWLDEAMSLDEVLAQHYEDREAGGYFMTSDDHESLLAREKPSSDGAEPSGNSVQALNLLRLSEFTTDDRYRMRADATLRGFAGILSSSPAALSEMLLALDFRLDVAKEIVIVTPGSQQQADPFLARLRGRFVPNRILVVLPGDRVDDQTAIVPLLDGKVALGGKVTAYVCEKGVCALPTSDPSVFEKQLSAVVPLADGN
jgi:uncharacterized protein YyaL (SSP411 family)